MPYPIDLRLGSLTLSLHLIFETLGFAIGFRYIPLTITFKLAAKH